MSRKVISGVLIGYGSVGRYHARQLHDRYGTLAIVDFGDDALARAGCDFPSATLARSLSELDAIGWPWATSMCVIATWGPSHAALFAELVRRGVRCILCEKPLAQSLKAGADMIKTADSLGIALGVNMHVRYSGFVSGLRELSDNLELGEPCNIFMHAGAVGLVTRGIHLIDMACELFGQGAESVVSSAIGAPINPRSPDLEYYGGTAAWDFGNGRETTFSFSNRSSIEGYINIYYRNALIRVLPNLDVEVRRRVSADVERFPAVTRVGEPSDLAFTGPVPGLRSPEERTTILLNEIESGGTRHLPPPLALQALGACIGALAAGRSRQAVSLPIDPDSVLGQEEWPIS